MSMGRKNKLALDIFDLDQNHVITYDEMLFMTRSFMNGIGIMTEAALFHKAALDSLGDQAFVLADSTPDGEVTFEEYFLFRLIGWIQSNEVLYQLFTTNQPNLEFNRRGTKRLSLIEKTGLERAPARRNTNFSGTNYVIRNKSEPRQIMNKKEQDALLSNLAEIFKKTGNVKGRIKAKNFYDAVVKNRFLSKNSEELLSQFNFRLQEEISFDDVKSCIGQRKNVRRNTEQPSRSNQDIKNMPVLKSLFDQYDIDNSGTISLKELKIGMRGKFSDTTIEELFKEYDEDGNGVLDFHEFMKLFCPDGASIPDNL